ncbi:MAG: glycosyltransferase [Verrucomicrobia bacterium]|nr:glycosyltransferase [Verrucomicrobiota bacterium]
MKICFVFSGELKYRQRMFKQIRALQEAGAECSLIHGWSEAAMPDYSEYAFRVTPYRVIFEKSKILTIATVLKFNFFAAKVIAAEAPDAVVCCGLSNALGGAIAKRNAKSVKFVFDSNELTLEMLSGVKKLVFGRFQWFALKHADVVMHAERHRLEYFEQRYPSRANSFLLENLPYYRECCPERPSETRRFVYFGLLIPDRHIEELIEAFAGLRDDGITLDIIGFGEKKYEQVLQRLCDENPRRNVRILPPVAASRVHENLAEYDVGFAFYQNTNLNNYYCAPTKIYDYIQMGMPVISNDFPGVVDIVEKNNAGVCISSVTPENIRDAITRIVDHRIANNITPSLRRRYSWESQCAAYLRIFGIG